MSWDTHKTEMEAQARVNKLNDAHAWDSQFCPVANGKCRCTCVCFVTPRKILVDRGCAVDKRWYSYGHHCNNAMMFPPEEINIVITGDRR
jgi:hypothetical protein